MHGATILKMWSAAFILMATCPCAVALPSETEYGYLIAIRCFDANGWAKESVERSGGQGQNIAEFDRASRKAHDFAVQTAKMLGINAQRMDEDFRHSRNDLKRMMDDPAFFKKTIQMCRDLDLMPSWR